MEFEKLVSSIQNTHEELQLSAIKAVNQSLTLRNWLIGLYIIEFEQKGKERAKYGEQLLPELAASIKIKGLSVTNLRLCRQFYIAYPHLISAVKDALINSNLKGVQIGQAVSDKLQSIDYKPNTIHQTLSDELPSILTPAGKLLDSLIKKYKLAIFVDGEFWHGFDWKNNKERIKSNRLFWIPKIERNMQKDIRVNKALRDIDYVVFRFWTQDILKNLPIVLNQIELFLETRKLWK